MFNLFKKKFKDIKEYPETWAVTKSVYNDMPIFIRVRDGLKEAIGHPDYPYIASVMVLLKTADENGLPSNEEGKPEGKLWQIEEGLKDAFTSNDESVFAFVTTVNSQRQFHYYVKEWKPEYFHAKVNKVKESFPEYDDFEFQMGKDPKWVNMKPFFN